eukprot:TRINITY_DN1973_c0_g1_i2.p1 TRINITY_DN1973_c0_g1~~TRINITY_DN1973_c0_g1_i2.p1  ORF type:complete len:371 (+),score=155.74 TRINITY_DN1973_c0_g1_i2:68-1180(+)
MRPTFIVAYTVFNEMVNFIPSKYYFASEKPNEQWKNKFRHHNAKGEAPRQAMKEASKKAKKRKLDPSKYKTVLDIQETNGGKLPELDDDEESSSSPGVDDSDESGTRKKRQRKNSKDDKPVKKKKKKPLPQLSQDASLQERLHHRIQVLKRSRNAEDDVDQDKKRAKRAKLAAKQKGGDKKDTRKRNTKLPKTMTSSSNEGSKGDASSGDGIQFSKFDFTPANPQLAEEERLKEAARKRAKLGTGKKKDLKLLEKAEKLAKAKADSGSSWGTLLQKAEGVKVKDNPALIKKAIKRKEKAKEKSQAKWKDRQQQVKKAQKEKQKKREENLAARKANKGQKGKKGKGKAGKGGSGGKRAGFEGKKKGFINKK